MNFVSNVEALEEALLMYHISSQRLLSHLKRGTKNVLGRQKAKDASIDLYPSLFQQKAV